MNLNRRHVIIAVLAWLVRSAPVSAQNLCAPVAKVNDPFVTEFGGQQPRRFLKVEIAPGATRVGALTSLIERNAAQPKRCRGVIELTHKAIAEALSDFRPRADPEASEEFNPAKSSPLSRTDNVPAIRREYSIGGVNLGACPRMLARVQIN